MTNRKTEGEGGEGLRGGEEVCFLYFLLKGICLEIRIRRKKIGLMKRLRVILSFYMPQDISNVFFNNSGL